jgi:hypothetical protein
MKQPVAVGHTNVILDGGFSPPDRTMSVRLVNGGRRARGERGGR